MDSKKQEEDLIYKLASSGTKQKKEAKTVKIEGFGIDRKTLKTKFPKKKYITQMETKALMKVAEEEQNAKWYDRYNNANHCLDSIITHNKKAFGKFCKNRCCLVCCSIRKAMYINKFLPIVESWNDPYFVTLTCQSKSKYNLKKWLRQLITNFDKVNRRLRKRYERGKGPKPVAIKAVECNYNPVRYTYNPHIHLIIPSKEIAIEFIIEWQNTYGLEYTDPRGQDMRPVGSRNRDLIEVIKYGAKIFTDPDMIKEKEDRTKDPIIYASALHNIYMAMDGCNLLSTIGFIQPETTFDKPEIKTETSDFEDWFYDPKVKDWVNGETAQIMTSYKPEGKLEYLLEERINLIKD